MRVVLADDHAMMREGLRALLEKAGIGVIGEAETGRGAVEETLRLRPDAVVMDVGMPELNGVEASRQLTQQIPGVRIVALSTHADRRYVTAMLAAGASAYVLKNAAAKELLDALLAVTRGETYLSPGLEGGPTPSSSVTDRPLSRREREVLSLLAEGKSSKEIAVKLLLAVPTVETHRRQIAEKLGLRTIAELTKYAIRTGLTSAER